MIIKNGILDPRNFCVYDNKGNRIKESCVIRDTGIVYKPEEKINPNCKYKNEAITYAGALSPSFGHLITEGVSRFWYPSDKFYHHEKRKSEIKTKFLELAEINTTRIIEKRKFKSIVIPEPSFQNRLSCTQNHKVIFERMAEKLSPSINVKGAVYLSRKNLPNDKRKVINEKEIEDIFPGDVIYPEKHSLEDQIRIINEYSIIVGCLGSAMHLLLFRLQPPKRSVILWRSEAPNTYPNYIFVDKIKEIKSEYHFVLKFDEKCNKESGKRNMIADINKINGILK